MNDERMTAARELAGARRALLRWFDQSARELPWRSRRDPYRVWISEVMLQQTRVEAVIEPYRRFIARFPSLASLARAQESEVLACWSGLGYYRRARLLHAGARHVSELHRGRIPRSSELLRSIPGIGSYTAAALQSIAFGQREAALDANVTRVVARLCAADTGTAQGRAQIRRSAGTLVDCDRPGDVNEALMDLGSAICTARAARCDCCPVARHCRGCAGGDPLSIARRPPRKEARSVELACAVVRDGDKVLFVRRPPGETLLAGLWELPTVELDGNDDAAPALRRMLLARCRIAPRLEGPLMSVRHEIVGRKIVARVYAGRWRDDHRFADDVRMLAPADRSAVGLPALPVKILRALGEPAPKQSPAARGAV